MPYSGHDLFQQKNFSNPSMTAPLDENTSALSLPEFGIALLVSVNFSFQVFSKLGASLSFLL